MIEELFYLAAEAGTGAGSPIWLTVVALLFGTGGVTTALITSVAGRRKNRADTSKSLVEATAQILGPYSTAIEMQKNQIMDLLEKTKEKDREIRALEVTVRRQEVRIRELEAKVAQYERVHGPLTTP